MCKTMTTLEREVIEKFRQLDHDAQQRVRKLIVHETDPSEFDIEAWLAEAEAAQITLHSPSASDLVSEVREERDADILHSLGFRDSADDRTD